MTDDTISRQAAIDAMKSISDSICGQQAIDALCELPSAQPDPCDDPRADIYYLAEKIGIHRLYALVVELRGEPEPCKDAVSRQAAIDALCEDYCFGHHDCKRYPKCENLRAIQKVPPAQPTDADIQKMQDIEQAMLEKAYECGKQDAAQWIPCSERLPDNRVSVIVCYREWQQYAKRYIYSIVIGWYARKHSVRENVFSEWEGDCDYDEDEDEFYIQEGWYEFTTQGNADLMNWYINAEVIAWMPLPEPYAERRTDALN